jgi:uncharacterized glyoxalase superfamily protein PhnB
MSPQTALQTIFPALRYHDAPAAIDWLERAFGFERRMVVDGDGATVEHAELALGDAMIMLGSVRPPDAGAYSAVAPPPGTSSLYVVVDDPDALAARARDAGAEIVRGPEDTGYGSRECTARDPDGNVWSFGTYQPWASSPSGEPQASSVGDGGGTL